MIRRIVIARTCRFAWLGLALLLASCKKPPGTVAGGPTLTLPLVILNFNASRPLTSTTAAEIFPEFQLTDPELVPEPLIFASGRIDTLNLREPVILRQTAAGWKFVEIPALNHTGWVYAGAAYERNELWAILDCTPEAPSPGLYLFRSTDKGTSWGLFSGLRPPAIATEFIGFILHADGTGTITLHQDDDTPALPRGVYTYQTTDGAKTWTGPTFSADDLISADPPAFHTLPESIKALDIGPPTAPAPSPGRGMGPGRGR